MNFKIDKISFVLLAGVVVTSSQAVIFSENFESLLGYTKGSNTVNSPSFSAYVDLFQGDSFWTTFGNWDVLGNTNPATGIDLVGTDYAYGGQGVQGRYGIDLAGSPAPGSIEYIFGGSNAGAFGSGSYLITFWAFSNASVSDSTIQTWVDGIVVDTHIATTTGAYHSFLFNGDINSLRFANTSSGFGNVIFDNLSIEAVPEPFTMALGVAGLSLALRRRIKKSV